MISKTTCKKCGILIIIESDKAQTVTICTKCQEERK